MPDMNSQRTNSVRRALDQQPAERARGGCPQKRNTNGSGDSRRRVLERGEFETRTDELKAGLSEAGSKPRWRRSERDRIGRSVGAVARREQGNRAFVGGAGRLMNAFVELRRGQEDEREEKCADRPGGHNRAQRDQLAVAKTQLHCGRVCFLRGNIASMICGRCFPVAASLCEAQKERPRAYDAARRAAATGAFRYDGAFNARRADRSTPRRRCQE